MLVNQSTNRIGGKRCKDFIMIEIYAKLLKGLRTRLLLFVVRIINWAWFLCMGFVYNTDKEVYSFFFLLVKNGKVFIAFAYYILK